ncbi:NhaP-type Na+/H+ or K+/H+ antiporter [Friedmanniella endophytica]|uniref:NhaP-type Na+/H+ or K+/H+ antiporter n=1 Tax=Microlunatus kandeliicorticis TaxID=1759536 RepID=A0A7W3IRG9_9ACTN|nr:DUF4235 domain-containing protein [Microlunatus kandeliicorticis]MBA8793881.1 NhaP-type Na+/H+ or K+/H+ antiporter [Microlunatus kandeliicorticis]
MANLAKIVYRPVGLVGGVVAGIVAGAIFKRVWKIVDREHDAPDALQAEYSWPKMLLAATLQGAIFAAVKAAIDRGGAKGFERATGEWPGS